MSYSTQNNAKDNDRSVNTRGIALYNKNGFDPSSLSIGFWNDSFVSLKINPALEPSKQTQSRVFDYDKTVSTALGIPAIQLLSHAIKTKIFKAIEDGEERSVGIQVGGDSLVTVGTGKRLTGEIRPYIAIHKSLNPQTKRPEMSIYYEFNKGQIIEDFNEETGAYSLDGGINSELMLFVNILDASVAALSKGDAHALRTVMRAYNDKLMNTTLAIGSKMGVQTQTYSPGRSGGARVDFASSTPAQPASDMDVEYGSIDDLNEYMD